MAFDSTGVIFNLSAVDWRTVSLLEGAHLEADRVYIEEMLRCALHFGGRSGVAQLGQNDLITGEPSARSDSFRVSVRLQKCFAVTPRGYLVCWDSKQQPGEGLFCSVDGANVGDVVPIYLCIDTEREKTYASPPQEIRNDCGFVRPRFRLATETGGGELDALRIGQLNRDGNNALQLDRAFIPECLRLDSHWLLQERVLAIKGRARTCMDNLHKQLESQTFRLEAMAFPLGMAAALEDWTLSPYAYIERMLAVMRANFALSYLIPQETGLQPRVYARLDEALRYIEPNLKTGRLEWAKALTMIEQTFTVLEGAFAVQTNTRVNPDDRSISGGARQPRRGGVLDDV